MEDTGACSHLRGWNEGDWGNGYNETKEIESNYRFLSGKPFMGSMTDFHLRLSEKSDSSSKENVCRDREKWWIKLIWKLQKLS